MSSAATISAPVSTLFAEDNESLRTVIMDLFDVENASHISVVSSADEALAALSRQPFGRVIADLRFDGETEDGVEILRRARASAEDCDLYLMTGQVVTAEVRDDLNELGAALIPKGTVSAELIKALFSGKAKVAVPVRLSDARTADLGELRLRYEELEKLNQLLIEDVLREIDAMPDQHGATLQFGPRRLSPAELRREVERRTQIGEELVRHHHELFKLLRGAAGRRRK